MTTEETRRDVSALSEGLGLLAPTVGWWKPGAGLNASPTLTIERPAGVCYAVCLTIEAERTSRAEVAAERERVNALLTAIREHWIKANGKDAMSVSALDVIAGAIADGSYVLGPNVF